MKIIGNKDTHIKPKETKSSASSQNETMQTAIDQTLRHGNDLSNIDPSSPLSMSVSAGTRPDSSRLEAVAQPILVKEQEVRLESTDIAKSEPRAQIWQRAGTIKQDGGEYLLFEFPEEVDLQEQNEILFPAAERSLKSVKKSLAPFHEQFELLGIRVIKKEGKEFLQLPSLETLSDNWKKLQEKYPHTPDLKLQGSEGVAGDQEFVDAFLNDMIVLSNGEEFVHDFQVHLIHMFQHVFNEQKNYAKRIEFLNHELEKLHQVYGLNPEPLQPDCSLPDLRSAIDNAIQQIRQQESIPPIIQDLLVCKLTLIKGYRDFVKFQIEQTEKLLLHDKDHWKNWHSLILGITTDTLTGIYQVINYQDYQQFNEYLFLLFDRGFINEILWNQPDWKKYINTTRNIEDFQYESEIKYITETLCQKIQQGQDQLILVHGPNELTEKMKTDQQKEMIAIDSSFWDIDDILDSSSINTITFCGVVDASTISALKDAQNLSKIKKIDFSEAVGSKDKMEKAFRLLREHNPSIEITPPIL